MTDRTLLFAITTVSLFRLAFDPLSAPGGSNAILTMRTLPPPGAASDGTTRIKDESYREHRVRHDAWLDLLSCPVRSIADEGPSSGRVSPRFERTGRDGLLRCPAMRRATEGQVPTDNVFEVPKSISKRALTGAFR